VCFFNGLKINETFTSLNDPRSEVAMETNAILGTKQDKNWPAVGQFGEVKNSRNAPISWSFQAMHQNGDFVWI
jgi:hypothetical protein